MSEEQKTENKWEPGVGMTVMGRQSGRTGKLIGVNPPGMSAVDDGWRVLVNWDDSQYQDSWHDLDDLEWASEYGGLPDPE